MLYRNLRDIEVILICKLHNDAQPVTSHCIIIKVQLREEETLLKTLGVPSIMFCVSKTCITSSQILGRNRDNPRANGAKRR